MRTSHRPASPAGSGPQQGPTQSGTHRHQSHHSFKSPGLLQYLSRPCRGDGLQGQKNVYINTGRVDGAADVQGLAPEEPALSPSQGHAAQGPAGLQSWARQGLSSRPHSCPRSAHALRTQGHAGSLLSCRQRLRPLGWGPAGWGGLWVGALRSHRWAWAWLCWSLAVWPLPGTRALCRRPRSGTAR